MNKTQQKRMLIATQPNCPLCGCKMVVTDGNERFGKMAHSAMIEGDNLICFQCHRLAVKERELNKLPLFKRWWKKLDRLTGIPHCFHILRVRWQQFVYFKIHGGIATSRKPNWLP